jgi:hypothetical protein
MELHQLNQALLDEGLKIVGVAFVPEGSAGPRSGAECGRVSAHPFAGAFLRVHWQSEPTVEEVGKLMAFIRDWKPKPPAAPVGVADVAARIRSLPPGKREELLLRVLAKVVAGDPAFNSLLA